MGNIKENVLVVKHNDLIQASYTLTLQEARIIILLASMITRDDTEFKLYKIAVKDFAEFIGLQRNKNIYRELLDITSRLRKRSLVIKKDNSILELGWLSSAEYYLNEGYVELEFSDKLRPYLLQLKERFTKIQLDNILKLKGFYSIRLYELLKQWEKLRSKSVEVSELRYYLGLKEGSYKRYSHLKNGILLRIQEEINEKTDIYFSFTEIKKGRKVVIIRFEISRKSNIESPPLSPVVEKIPNPNIYQILIDFYCISPNDAFRICKEYQSSQIEANLEYVKHKYNDGKINDIGAYTIKAIKEDYRLQRSLFEDRKKEKAIDDQEEKNEEKYKIDYEYFKRSRIDDIKSSMPEDDLKRIIRSAEDQYNREYPTVAGKRRFGKKGHIAILVNQVIEDRHKIPAYDEWKTMDSNR